MPEVSRFYGIIIRFYYRDHPPTHFHAIYGEHEALVEIETGSIHKGPLPRTAHDLVERSRLVCRRHAAAHKAARLKIRTLPLRERACVG